MFRLVRRACLCVLFFFNDTATTEIYTLSLHDALPIFGDLGFAMRTVAGDGPVDVIVPGLAIDAPSAPTVAALRAALTRSEEHTSELQSLAYLVCRLLLEKKKRTAELDQ